MKILHILDSDGIYGAEVMLLNLMGEHMRMGHEPILLSMEDPTGSEKRSLAEEALKRGLDTIKFKSNRGYSLKSANKIIKYAVERGVELVHSHGYKGNILLASLPKHKRRMPIISTLHGWTSTTIFSKIWFYTIIDKFFLRRLDAVVYVNPLAANVIKHGTNFVVANGIPEINFDNRSSTFSDPEIQKFCEHGFVIGTISRLSDEKGLVHLINAMRLLLERSNKYKAVIIGEGPQKSLLQEIIQKNNLSNKVLLAGYRNNAFNYLPFFNVFVLPSLTEGLPITILEAMQAEIPIVATKVGGIPSILENGKQGIVINPADPEALAEAICSIDSNPHMAREMGENARDTALTKYSSQRMAKEYLQVYESVLRKEK